MKMKDGLVWVLFYKALIVDGGEGHGLYFFTFFIFMFVIFGIFCSWRRGGGSEVWGFFIKNYFVLLTFLIVCKFFVIFFHFQRRKGGARV